MGQAPSTMDFRNCVLRLRREAVPLTDHEFWRTVFITTLTADDLAAFFAWDDVRYLRRLRPRNLAVLLHKCVEQLECFTASSASIVDHTAASNSIRILTQALPALFEPVIVPAEEPPLTKSQREKPAEPLPPGGKSEFADDFLQHVFWENKMCDGDAPLLTNGGVPLGQRLVQLLVRCCFIPGFTVGRTQQSEMVVSAIDGGAREEGAAGAERVEVDGGLQWFGGLFTEKATTINFTNSTMRNRVDVLRCILAILSGCVFRRDVLFTNPFLMVLRDQATCPLAPTLCAALLATITTHQSRGVLPYTSYLGADLPENLLALAIQVLAVVLAPDRGTLLERIPVPPSGCWWAVVKHAMQHETYRRSLHLGIQRVVENPLYTTQTYLSGSQKTVMCHVEALILLLVLCEQHPVAAQHLAENTTGLLYPLLFFVQEAKVDNLLFGEVQIISYILMILSTNRTFIDALQTPTGGKVPLTRIPANANASLGDVLVLTICMVISPSSPRWLLPLFPIFGTLFTNIAGHVAPLTELTCFEVHHMLEFVTSRHFLRRGEPQQLVCALVVEGVCNMLQFATAGTLPLAASLGVSDVATNLAELLAKRNEELEHEEDENTKTIARPLVLSDSFREQTKAELLLHFSSFAKEKLQEAERASKGSGRSSSADKEAIYRALGSAMASGLNISGAQLTLRRFTVTDEVKAWVLAYCWGIIHHHNTKPPLFDAAAAVAFRVR